MHAGIWGADDPTHAAHDCRLEGVATGMQPLRAFVEFGALMSDADLSPEEGGEGKGSSRGAPRDAVQLMSIHASKGKEWESVHIIGCFDGLLPMRLCVSLWSCLHSLIAGCTDFAAWPAVTAAAVAIAVAAAAAAAAGAAEDCPP